MKLGIDSMPIDGNYDAKTAKINNSFSWILGLSGLKDASYSFATLEDTQKRAVLEDNLVDGTAYQKVVSYIFKDVAQVKTIDDVVKILCRHGMYVLRNDAIVSPQSLAVKPINIDIHLALVDMLMMAACSFAWMLIGNVVAKVKNIHKFSPSQDLPNTIEDAVVLWISKVVASIKEKHLENSEIFFPSVSHNLDDLCDSSILCLLLHYYYPQTFSLNAICLKETNSLADAIHNTTSVLEFLNESVLLFPTPLQPQDFLNCNEELRPNFIAFFSLLFYSLEMEKKTASQKDESFNAALGVTGTNYSSTNVDKSSTSAAVLPNQNNPVLPTNSDTTSNNSENLSYYDVIKGNNQPLLPRRPQQAKPGSRQKKRFVENSLRKSVSLDDITNQQQYDELLPHNQLSDSNHGDFVAKQQSMSADKRLPSHKFWQRGNIPHTDLLGKVDVGGDEIEEILSSRTDSTVKSSRDELDWSGFTTRPQHVGQSQPPSSLNRDDLVLETYRTIPSFRARPLDLMTSGSSEFTEVTFASSEVATSDNLGLDDITHFRDARPEVMNSNCARSEVMNSNSARSQVMNSNSARSEVMNSNSARSEVMNSNSETITSNTTRSEVMDYDITSSKVTNSDTPRSEVTNSNSSRSEVTNSNSSRSEVMNSNSSKSEVTNSVYSRSEVTNSVYIRSEVTNSDDLPQKTSTLSVKSAGFSPEIHPPAPPKHRSQLSYVVDNGMSKHGIERGYPVIPHRTPYLLKVNGQSNEVTSTSKDGAGSSNLRKINNCVKMTSWEKINGLVKHASTQTNGQQGFHQNINLDTRCQNIWQDFNQNSNNTITCNFARDLEVLICKYFPTQTGFSDKGDINDVYAHSKTISPNNFKDYGSAANQPAVDERLINLVANSETLHLNAPSSGESTEVRSRRNLFSTNQKQAVPTTKVGEPIRSVVHDETVCYSKFQDNLKFPSCQSTPAKSPQPGTSDLLEVTVVNAHNRSGLGYEIAENRDNDRKKTQEKKKEQFLMSRIKKEEQTREQQFERQKEKEEKQIKQREKQEKIWQKREEEKEKREKRLREYKEKKAKERNRAEVIFLESKEKSKKTNSAKKKRDRDVDPIPFLQDTQRAKTSRPLTPTNTNLYPTSSNQARTRNSDTESNGSVGEYSGPKLFKELTAKSNKSLIQNALNHCCLPGKVNEVNRNKTIQMLKESDCKHFMILFRDDKCQYRGVYSFIPKMDKLDKLTGNGPPHVKPGMVEALFRYDSGQRSFTVTASKTLSVAIHAFTIHTSMWGAGRQKR